MATEYHLPEYAQTGASLPPPLRSVLRGPIVVYDFLSAVPDNLGRTYSRCSLC